MPDRAVIEAATPSCPGCGELLTCDHDERVWTCEQGKAPAHTGLAGVTFEYLASGLAGLDAPAA